MESGRRGTGVPAGGRRYFGKTCLSFTAASGGRDGTYRCGSAACDLYSIDGTGGDEPRKLGRFQLACDRAGNSPEYQEWKKRPPLCRTPGGGECYNDVVKRTLDAMEYIMKRENGDVLIVTHSAIIMALRCYIAGLPFDEMVRKFKDKKCGSSHDRKL